VPNSVEGLLENHALHVEVSRYVFGQTGELMDSRVIRPESEELFSFDVR
jgi:hypothetical protein